MDFENTKVEEITIGFKAQVFYFSDYFNTMMSKRLKRVDLNNIEKEYGLFFRNLKGEREMGDTTIKVLIID